MPKKPSTVLVVTSPRAYSFAAIHRFVTGKVLADLLVHAPTVGHQTRTRRDLAVQDRLQCGNRHRGWAHGKHARSPGVLPGRPRDFRALEHRAHRVDELTLAGIAVQEAGTVAGPANADDILCYAAVHTNRAVRPAHGFQSLVRSVVVGEHRVVVGGHGRILVIPARGLPKFRKM